MTFDATDKALADAIEQIIKDTQTHGIIGFADPVMTEAEYAPSAFPTLPRDFNRTLAIAITAGLRTHPLRVPVVSRSDLPPPLAGALVVVVDGTTKTLAFSDGTSWIDT